MKNIYRPGLLASFIIIFIIIEYGIFCFVYPSINIFKGNSANKTPNTTATTDSIADSVMVDNEKEICTVFIGDGRVFDVRGKIKTIKFYNGQEEIVKFDEQGHFKSKRFDGHGEYEITRDSQGRITYNHFFNDCKDTYYTGSYSYDNKERVSEYIPTSSVYENKQYRYNYDADDNLISASITYSVSGDDDFNRMYITNPMSFDSVVKYKILEKDDRGNWTKRQVTGYEYKATPYTSEDEEIDESYVEVGYTVYNDGSQHPAYCKKQKVDRKEARILEYYD